MFKKLIMVAVAVAFTIFGGTLILGITFGYLITRLI